MKSLLPVALIVVVLVLVAPIAGCGESTRGQHDSVRNHKLTGQLLLPPGLGSRGVEVRVMIAGPGDDPRNVWVLFDEQGRFTHNFRGDLVSLEVVAGIGREVHRIHGEGIPEVSRTGGLDVGVIDLRGRLSAHRLVVRAADGSPSGEVRVGMWSGRPPVGPRGAPVSLGSRQFPPIDLGTELEWLLPPEAELIYFLVERSSSSDGGTEWRGGHQRLFGPFTSADLPGELVMD